MAIDTLSNVKLRLGVTGTADDTLLSTLMESAEAWIASYCRRNFEAEAFTEYFSGSLFSLVLRNYPVAVVHSVRVDLAGEFGAETIIPASSYRVEAATGLIYSLTGPFLTLPRVGLINVTTVGLNRFPQSVRVQYSNVSAITADIQEAFAQLVGHEYRRVKTQSYVEFRNVTQQKLGDATSIFATAQIAGLPLPPDILQILAPYRMPLL